MTHFEKLVKFKVQSPGNRITMFVLRKHDPLRDHNKQLCHRTLSFKVFVIFYKLHLLNLIFCFQFSHIKLVTYNTPII